MQTTPDTGALNGVRVLDLASLLAGPVAATLLGDFGAEVVKVEEPGRGDFIRGFTGERSLQWLQEGRNKRSVAVDLRSEAGRALVHQLVPHFDVVVVNNRPPTLEKWGLDPETLQHLNPRAVLLYVSGYGLEGPYRDRGSFDRIASAFSGLTYVSGEPDGDPVRAGYSVIDFMSAYLAAFAVVTALRHRDVNGGSGQVIDLALYEAAFRASEASLMVHSATGVVRERLGNRNPYIAPASDFVCADGRRVSLHAGTQPLFERLSAAMGRADLVDDARFVTAKDRIRNQAELYELIEEWARSLDLDQVMDRLLAHDVPSSPLMSIADISTDRHYRERGTIVRVEDHEHGAIDMAAPLPRMSGTPGTIRHLGSALGEDTDAVLTEFLGLDEAAVHALRDAGVVA